MQILAKKGFLFSISPKSELMKEYIHRHDCVTTYFLRI